MNIKLLYSLLISSIIVLLFNFAFNPNILGIKFNEFLNLFYASISSSSQLSMDILTFSQITLVILVEITLIWTIFYYVTRKLFT